MNLAEQMICIEGKRDSYPPAAVNCHTSQVNSDSAPIEMKDQSDLQQIDILLDSDSVLLKRISG